MHTYTNKEQEELQFNTLEELLDYLRENDKDYYNFAMSEGLFEEDYQDVNSATTEEIERQNLGYILTK